MASDTSPTGGFVDPEKIKKVTEFFGDYKRKIEDITRALNPLAKATSDAGDAAAKAGEQYKGLTAGGVAGVLSLVEGLKSFARAGLEGTGQAAMLGFQFQQLSRGVAAVFLPVINTAIEVVKKLADWFRNLSEHQQNALQGLAVGATVAKVAMSALGGPVGLVAGALAGLLSGTTAGQQILGRLGDAFGRVLDAVSPLLDAVGDLFDTLLTAAGPAIDSVIGTVGELVQAVGPMLAELVEAARPLIAAWYQGLATAFQFVGDVLRQVIPLFQPLTDAVSELFEAVRPLVEDLGSAFRDFLEDIKPVVAFILEDMVNAIREAIKALTQAVAAIRVLGRTLKGELSIGDYFENVDNELARIRDKAAGSRRGPDRDNRPGRKIGPSFGNFEDVSQAFLKLQQAAQSVTGEKEKDWTDDVHDIAVAVQKMANNDKGINPNPPAPEGFVSSFLAGATGGLSRRLLG